MVALLLNAIIAVGVMSCGGPEIKKEAIVFDSGWVFYDELKCFNENDANELKRLLRKCMACDRK